MADRVDVKRARDSDSDARCGRGCAAAGRAVRV